MAATAGHSLTSSPSRLPGFPARWDRRTSRPAESRGLRGLQQLHIAILCAALHEHATVGPAAPLPGPCLLLPHSPANFPCRSVCTSELTVPTLGSGVPSSDSSAGSVVALAPPCCHCLVFVSPARGSGRWLWSQSARLQIPAPSKS